MRYKIISDGKSVGYIKLDAEPAVKSTIVFQGKKYRVLEVGMRAENLGLLKVIPLKGMMDKLRRRVGR